MFQDNPGIMRINIKGSQSNHKEDLNFNSNSNNKNSKKRAAFGQVSNSQFLKNP